MRARLATMVTLIVLACSALGVMSSSAFATSVKPFLCKHQSCGGKPGAWEQAEKDAKKKWCSSAQTTSISNEFENRVEHTQFAVYGVCYSFLGEVDATWQINLGPYGEITYEHFNKP